MYNHQYFLGNTIIYSMNMTTTWTWSLSHTITTIHYQYYHNSLQWQSRQRAKDWSRSKGWQDSSNLRFFWSFWFLCLTFLDLQIEEHDDLKEPWVPDIWSRSAGENSPFYLNKFDQKCCHNLCPKSGQEIALRILLLSQVFFVSLGHPAVVLECEKQVDMPWMWL